MAEISLQEYIAAIEAQIAGGAADEATYHSRYILSRYPKYTPAYRLLGRGLLLKGQLDEAEAAFRRVLSIEPSDITAHLGLSELYDQRRRGDEAIWHAERAMETEIANAITSDLLSTLYRRYRGEEWQRMSLTAAALARQAMRNHDDAQAVATLRDALDRQPERVDLRLLLAEALWASGDHVAAAETASDVLEVLPDCFGANAILTRLWLEVGRPSDAQPYLYRLESVDPYAALALATNQAADPAAFLIEPLDYQRSAQSDMARAAPDWLAGIPTEVNASTPDTPWESGMLAAAAPEPEPEAPTDAVTVAVPIVAASVGESFAPAAPAAPEPVEELPDLTAFDFEEPLLAPSVLADEPTLTVAVTPPAPSMLTRPLDAMPDDPLPDLDALFGDEPEGAADFVSPFDEREPSLPVVPAAGATTLLSPIDSGASHSIPPAEDALAWLRESGVELIEDEAPAFSIDTGNEFPTAATQDQLDPMAWLNTYDSVLADAATGEQPTTTDAPASDWQHEQWDPDAVDLGSFAENPAEDELAAPPNSASPLRGLTSRLGDPAVVPPPPPPEQPAALVDNEVLDEWLAQFDETPATPIPEEAHPEWLTDLGAVMTTESDSTTPVENDAEAPLPTGDEDAAWLNEFSPDALRQDMEGVPVETEVPLPDAPAVDALPDWLVEHAPDAAVAMGAVTGDTPPPALDDSALPDWLKEHAPEAAAAMAAEAASGAPQDEAFDWMTTLNEPVVPAADLDEAVMAAQADVPDWLTELEAEVLAQVDANQNRAETGETDAEFAAAEVAAAETLPFDESVAEVVSVEEFVSEEPVVEVVDSETFAAEELYAETVAGEEFVSEEPVAEAVDSETFAAEELYTEAVAGEEFVSEEPVAEAVESEAFAVEEPAADLAAAALAVAALSSDAPELAPEDWGAPESADLSRIAPPSVSLEDAGPPAEITDDWFADGTLIAEAPVPADGTLVGGPADDWFADAALLAPAEAAADEWPSEAGGQPKATQVGVETVAWATDPTETEAEAGGSPEVAIGLAAGVGALGVLAMADGETEAETAPGEAAVFDELDEDADWLAEEWPEDAEAPVLQADELDELPDVEIADETVIAPATNAPDWLNAMVPGLDMDYVAAEDEPLESGFAEDGGALDETLGGRRDYAWVIDLIDQESRETELAPVALAADAGEDGARFVFHRLPAWFRATPDEGSDDDFADWPSDDSSLQAWQN